MLAAISVLIVGVCWGSFLNVVGYRLVNDMSIIWPASRCDHCVHPIAWYDNIPIISWLVLQGKCRSCAQSISILYPLIELFSGIVFTLLYYTISPHYFIIYGIFFSGLIAVIRSDSEYMLISPYTTLALIPCAFVASVSGYLPVSPLNSILSAVVGYGFLWAINRLFWYVRGQEGLGEGDMDLLAFIGAYTGIIGCWTALLIGSLSASLYGLAHIVYNRSHSLDKIPFGPFLSIGAIIYVLCMPFFAAYMWYFVL